MSEKQFEDRRAGAVTRGLERALADQTRFSARLTGEMKSPLQTIESTASGLLNSDGLDADQRKALDLIANEATALRRIIEDLHELSTVGSDRMELLSEPFAPRSLCDEVAAAHRPGAQVKGFDIVVDIDPQTPRILIGDRLRVQQILENLVSNSVKYTDDGEVAIRLERAGVDPSSGIGLVRFVVSDTGRGIPADRADRLFEPYQRSGAGSGTTGVGLTLTKMLVELMGGTIWLSPTEVGTTFVCELPLREGRRSSDRELVAAAEHHEQAIDRSPSLPILVYEESDVKRLLLAAQLKQLGHRVVLASSAAEVLEIIAANPVDVVLMDCDSEASRSVSTQIRAMGDEILQPKILGMATHGQSDLEAFDETEVFDGQLSKPVSYGVLSSALERWLPEPNQVTPLLTSRFSPTSH